MDGRVPTCWGDLSVDGREELSETAGRAFTMLLALDRLHGARALASSDEPLAILVLGPDAREGSSEHELVRTFEPLVRALLESRAPSAASRRLDVSLVLIGPNLLCSSGAIPFERTLHAAGEDGATHIALLRITSLPFMLHEEECADAVALPFACAFAFNAGLWGYESWLTSIQCLGRLGNIPLVCTSYNELEADEDAGALEDMGLLEALDWRWAPEPNPFAAMSVWPNSLGRSASDNGWWQCVDVRRSVEPQPAGDTSSDSARCTV